MSSAEQQVQSLIDADERRNTGELILGQNLTPGTGANTIPRARRDSEQRRRLVSRKSPAFAELPHRLQAGASKPPPDGHVGEGLTPPL
jgi:hypothetical protein